MDNINEIKIYTSSNIKELQIDKPPLSDGQLYIYVLLNNAEPFGNIKIGKTTNMIQRHKSLSGSNGGGYSIQKCYVSPATYMNSMETVCHNHYEWCRIPDTEWFKGNYLNYNDVVKYVDGLFHSDDFYRCNELRKQYSQLRFNGG